MKGLRETELYGPVKAFLEAQGYEVKAEVGPCDVMAIRAGADPVIVELKTGFTLTLLHQSVARQAITDFVYVAVPRGKGRVWQRNLKDNLLLCRRLGLGFLSVRIKDGFVEPHLDPGPYRPRKVKGRTERLLREFSRRVGDPNTGGTTRQTIVTAYRQDAVKLAAFLREMGPSKGAVVAAATGVEVATRMMRDDHYGWFEKVAKGVYQLTPRGLEERAGPPTSKKSG